METDSDTISFTRCCEIILSDWRYRQDNIAPELRDYKRELLFLLNKEFEIDWRDDEIGFDANLTRLPSAMPRGYSNISSPFSQLMENTFYPGQREVLDMHRGSLNVAKATLKALWVDLFRDLLLLQWPEAAHRETSWCRLRELGLGNPVDEIDFW